jgi:putative transposase
MRDRDYKIFRAGEYYHVFNRGNNKQPIFMDDADYLNFIKRCKLVLGKISDPKLNIKPLPEGCLDIVCYCLMPNHFHFLIKQNGDIGIDRFITKVCTSYAHFFNKKYERVGNLFQDAFKAKLVDTDTYLNYLSAYIHNNPPKPAEYSFSSFQDITGLRSGTLCNTNILLGMFENNCETYKKFVLLFTENQKSSIEHLTFEN